MANKILFSPKSVEDLDAIIEFYDNSNLSDKASEKVYESIISRIESLKELSNRGRIVPELWDEGISKYRELIEGHFRIIYRLSENTITIIRVLDSRRLNDFANV